jgi:hypothetical protein
MEPDEPNNSSQKPTVTYGKRPMWQWILIYVVVAIIIYGIIYYVFIRDSGTTGY